MDSKEKKAFSMVSRIGSFKHAFRGLYVFLYRTHNAWVEIGFIVLSAFLGYFFYLPLVAWLILMIGWGILLMAEAFNTAMEVHMDLTSPEFHPYARDTKDIAAGAVLIAVALNAIIFVLVFGPFLYEIAQDLTFS
jgi:diacylglycerol kinase (ATP)